MPQGDAPPIPAWLIDRCPSHAWAAGWEACAKQQAAALAASEARVAEYMEVIERTRQWAKDEQARSEAAEQSLSAMQARVDGLRAFAQDVMESWPEGAPDGGDLQEFAERHGLLQPVEMPAPCGEDCGCTEFLSADDFPATCYRKTSLLTGRPESDAAIAAIAAQRQEG